MSLKTIASCVDAVAAKIPEKIALRCPNQKVKQYSYLDLSWKSQALAGFLSLYGFEKSDLLVSDLSNTPENLLVQLACNRLAVGYGTTKNLEGLAKFPKVKGAIDSSGVGFLADTTLPLPVLSGDYLEDLIQNGLEDFAVEVADAGREDTLHGFYNTTVGYSNSMALRDGENAVWELSMADQDISCVSVTLCHPFGIGSAVTSTFLAGGTVVLPDVGGIRGCGVPSERAEATLKVLEDEKCTLLFADKHTLEALPEPLDITKLELRGGICKIGSGSDILAETRSYGGALLKTMGRSAA